MSDLDNKGDNSDPASWSSYFNYFTEVEEHFQKARGTSLFLLSPLDWALIESWKNTNVPLEAVLRGNRRRLRKVARETLASPDGELIGFLLAAGDAGGAADGRRAGTDRPGPVRAVRNHRPFRR